MALTLAQLITARTKEQWRQRLLGVLKGVGFVTHAGTGAGSLEASGVASQAASVIVEVLTSGELGAATFRYSLNGGSTWSGTITVPANGAYALGATGCTLTFAAAPADAGTSFVAGDRFTFSLTVPSFPVTSWQAGSLPLTIVELEAEVCAEHDRTEAKIAAGGQIDDATGAWLKLYARSQYQEEKHGAVATKGTCRLSDSGAGPHTFTAGQLWATTSTGKRFFNSTAGTLTENGTLDLEFTAELPGAAHNVGNGEISALVTAIPGVSISNPNPGTGLWITTQGVDEETDEAFRARCKAKWATLGAGASKAAYEYWATTASAQVTKTLVRASPTVPGEVDLYLAGPAGAVAAEVVTAVEGYVTPRMPLGVTLNCASAEALVVELAGTVKVRAAYLAAAQAAASAALQQIFSELPIGGEDAGGAGGIVSRERLFAAVASQVGVVDFNPTSPIADVEPTATQVATLTNSLVWEPV